jgi:hypothetical protein
MRGSASVAAAMRSELSGPVRSRSWPRHRRTVPPSIARWSATHGSMWCSHHGPNGSATVRGSTPSSSSARRAATCAGRPWRSHALSWASSSQPSPRRRPARGRRPADGRRSTAHRRRAPTWWGGRGRVGPRGKRGNGSAGGIDHQVCLDRGPVDSHSGDLSAVDHESVDMTRAEAEAWLSLCREAKRALERRPS